MATRSDKKEGRGLARASEQTRKRVAKMGGEAFHAKRGRNGSDNNTQGDAET